MVERLPNQSRTRSKKVRKASGRKNLRKIIMLISVDGYFGEPNKQTSLYNLDAEFNDHAINLLNNTDTLIFGRSAYELMASYWPTLDAIENDTIIAGKMNSLPKLVFSRKLDKVEWNNSRLAKDVEEIRKLKQLPGKDIIIFGNSDLALSFSKYGLIDEFHIVVNPIVLGKGKSLFLEIKERINLRFLKTKTFKSGNAILFYEPNLLKI